MKLLFLMYVLLSLSSMYSDQAPHLVSLVKYLVPLQATKGDVTISLSFSKFSVPRPVTAKIVFQQGTRKSLVIIYLDPIRQKSN